MVDNNSLTPYIEAIGAAINELLRDFEHNPEVFLTEEDIRCHLFFKLYSILGLQQLRRTADEQVIQSISVHSEIRWYGKEDKKLKYRSDIVIIPVEYLRTRDPPAKPHSPRTRIKKKEFNLPSKGYAFNGETVIVEIKLRRRNGETTKKFANRIENDKKKLEIIKSKVSDLPICYLLVLDKEWVHPENGSKQVHGYVTRI
ncbi:hypothetical protein COU37_01330 [Candidatus Micrarchaeota archaeon CG10_big_fil_rev_8_21_14_0_10_45_29]|nr:MAG: hypothetical protein COU37_01330 [Candidatus Micrarchaeota archaeon CG10_big_fil_rev_8_21_14_0_10_45_29]